MVVNYEPGVKNRVIEMAINGSGIHDTGRALKIDKNTVINTLKNKPSSLVQANPRIFELSARGELDVRLDEGCEAVVLCGQQIQPTPALVRR
ncbi:MAG: IS1-like element transposase [Methylobacter sp.]|nr:IS1-like element transposase [Methylobacter sp.]